MDEYLLIKAEKKWEEADFSDAFIFGEVLRRDSDIAKGIIELFNPDLDIDEVKVEGIEERIQKNTFIKYVIVDVLVRLKNGALVIIEMQASYKSGLPQRSRYYTSSIDTKEVKLGTEYKDIKEIRFMMICKFDLFGKGKYIYRFTNRDEEDPSIELNDGETRVFINTKGTIGELTTGQKNFINYVNNEPTFDDFTRRIDDIIKEIKKSGNMKYEYIFSYLDRIFERYDARCEGHLLGLEEGRKEVTTRFFKSFSQTGMSYEEIAKVLNLSEEEYDEIIKALSEEE